MLPDVHCSIADCSYSTGDGDAQVVAYLLNLHAFSHTQATPIVSPTAVQIICPLEGCAYIASAADSSLAASLLNLHKPAHQPNTMPTSKVEKVKQLTISSSGTLNTQHYFKTRYAEYVNATVVDC